MRASEQQQLTGAAIHSPFALTNTTPPPLSRGDLLFFRVEENGQTIARGRAGDSQS